MMRPSRIERLESRLQPDCRLKAGLQPGHHSSNAHGSFISDRT